MFLYFLKWPSKIFVVAPFCAKRQTCSFSGRLVARECRLGFICTTTTSYPPPPPSPPPQNPPPPPPQNPPPHHRHSHEHTSTILPPPPPINHNYFINPLDDNSSTFSNPLIVGALDSSAENEPRTGQEPRTSQVDSRRCQQLLHGVMAVKAPENPIWVAGEWQAAYPPRDSEPHANYLGELVREFPLHYPSLRQMPPERKAGVMVKIRTQFDLHPYMESDRWPQIYTAIQQHLQKLYNGKKAALKKRYWIPEEDVTYDVERIRCGRPSHISEVELDA
nr:hypothetical protein [Tanacetum cinerariifolium]